MINVFYSRDLCVLANLLGTFSTGLVIEMSTLVRHDQIVHN